MDNATIINKISNAFLSSLNLETKKLKKNKPVRIRYNGQFVTLKSGKTIWKRLGDAKSALRHDFNSSPTGHFEYKRCFHPDYFHYEFEGTQYTWEEAKKISENAYLEVLKVVEFVEVD